jgi:asparagine synthase (glutamine-hydrolysing)
MCGIAGIVHFDRERPVDVEMLHAMGRSIAHRGPDGSGTWVGRGVGFVHRRLAIIDVAGGQQPIANEDGAVHVVFNGEIYNYERLRRELLARGHRFRTNSDTEVLVHLYEEEGTELVNRLRGMFAFALWDQRRQRLLLARDRVGIKPLYWHKDDRRLLFSSELKGILADPAVQRTLDPEALESYLAYGVVSNPGSIFQNIATLPPGHTLVVDRGHWRAAPRRYWQLRFAPDPRPSVVEWQEAIRAKVNEVVRLHLTSDVPVGAFLSGGVDSSIIVGTAAALAATPLRTFSMGFAEEAFNELPAARTIATRFNTRHVEEIVTPRAGELLDELAAYFDEPFGDASAVPTFLVSRLARRSVKVVLSGDGGDEAFGGYTRYAQDLREAAVRRRLPLWLRNRVLGPLARCWPRTPWLPRPLRVKSALTNLALSPDAAYANTLTVCRGPGRRDLLHPDLAAALNGHPPEGRVAASYRAAEGAGPLCGMLHADTSFLLPDDFLVKVDRASMANGLEVRPPFLDHELLELTARIPSRLKVRGGETKCILKSAYASALPRDILFRPKRGFDLPLDEWLAGPLRQQFHDTVLTRRAAVASLLNLHQVRTMFEGHVAGRQRCGRILWCLLMLAAWAERYLKSGVAPFGPAARQENLATAAGDR